MTEANLQKTSTKKSRIFAALEVRDFRFLWVSSLAASFGMQMQMVARGWLIYDMTQSPMALTWVMLSFMLPTLLFSLAGGVMADRLTKKPLILVTQALTTVATFSLGYIIYTGEVDFWHFIYIGFLNGTLMALSMPARTALVPEIMDREDLVNAMALQSETFNLARILGSALAGVLIAFFASGDTTSTYGVGVVFFIITAMYAISLISTAMLNHQGAPSKRLASSSALEDTQEGLTYMIEDRLMLGLMLIGLIPFMFGMVSVFLLPAFNQDILNGGPDSLGLLMTASGTGAFLGSMILARLGDFGGKGQFMFRASYLWALSLGVLSITTSLDLALVACALTGLFGTLLGSLHMSVVQLVVKEEFRGRIMSILMMTFGLMPLGIMPMSALAEYIGIDVAFIASAALLAMSMVALDRFYPELKRINKGHGQEA